MMVGIPILFFILTGLILWFIIGAKGNWKAKFLVFLFTLSFSLFVGLSLSELKGWPSHSNLPEKFELIWLVVEEPSEFNGCEGRIIVWLEDLKSRQSILKKMFNIKEYNRLYNIQYNDANKEAGQKALKGLKNGQRIIGEGKPSNKKEKGNNKGKGNKKGFGGDSWKTDDELYFYELPEPIFKPKDVND